MYAFEAELIAAMIGIETAHARGLRMLWLETDSTYVAKLLISRACAVPWRYRNHWLLVLSLLTNMKFRVSHIFREGNAVADALSNHDQEGFWTSVPDFIISHLGRNMSYQPFYMFTQH